MRAPLIDVEDALTTRMATISIRAVIIGAILNIVATVIGMFITAISIVNQIVLQTPGAVAKHAAAPLTAPPGTPLAMLLIGFAGCTLGGYVAGRIARRKAPLHGALSTFLVILLALAASFSPNASIDAQLIAIVGSPAFGLFGGVIAQFQQSRTV